MSLSTILKNRLEDQLSDDGGRWRQFILDHLDYIQNRSQTYVADEQTIVQYRYDFDRFIKEKIGRQKDITWIVLLLNNLANDFAFSDKTDYVIPSDELISNLYLSYTTIQANAQ